MRVPLSGLMQIFRFVSKQISRLKAYDALLSSDSRTFGRTNLAVQDMIGPLKEYFERKRAIFVATWTTDSDGIVHIPLKNGFEATISKSKKDIAAQFTWRLRKHSRMDTKFYAEAKVPESLRNKYGCTTWLHRVIVDAPKGLQVDHKNGNGLDCTDDNLRIATTSQNASNRYYRNSTGYRGVVRISKTNRFAAQIEINGKSRKIGSYAQASEAARRYNEEAILLFGEFAILNQFYDDHGEDLSHIPLHLTYNGSETTVA